ncbi:MAG: UTP--glucose-1-phosphate uridylyltransferase GalU [Tissierellia bacterium]|nr:UTP--glucose-1-phosphate uridylyltransferase GalU [Tissierellia bacterium]
MRNRHKVTKAVIPAAGLGTRFLPATKAQPKEMLPILDKPTLQYIVQEAYNSGIRDILVVTGRGKDSIVNHFDHSFELEAVLAKNKDWSQLNEIRSISEKVNMFYVRQKEPKGLGHAISCAEAFVGDEPFAVLLGDDIINTQPPLIKQMIDVYERYQSSVVGLLDVPDEDVSKYGIMAGEMVEDSIYKVEKLVEKPAVEDAPSNRAVIGRYVITPKIFDILKTTKPGKNNEIQLTDALMELSRHEDIYGYAFKGERYDVGDKFGFVVANLEFGLRDAKTGKQLKEYLRKLDLDRF